MQTNMDYFLTGYTDLRHSQVNAPSSKEDYYTDLRHSPNAPTSEEDSLLALMNHFMETTPHSYPPQAEKLDGPPGIQDDPSCLQESKLLSQLPWLTPWPALLEDAEPVKVFQIIGICNIMLTSE